MDNPKVPGKLEKALPGILTGIGIASFLTAIGSSIYATPKAILLIREEENRLGGPLEPIETVKAAAPAYIQTAVFAAVGTACIISSDIVQHKNSSAAILALGTAAEKTYTGCQQLINRQQNELDEYKKALADKFGEEAEKLVQKEADQKVIEPVYNMPLLTTSLRPKDPNDRLCIDMFTGNVFYNTETRIREAIVELNEMKQGGEDITMDDWCDAMGENRMDIGEDLKWDSTDTRQIKATVDEDQYGVYLKVRFVRGYGPRGTIKR